jgi:DNA-binding PadR family transcriptional regulator
MNDLLLLSLLLAGPRHGYALKKRAGLITGQPDMHNNLVYPLLRRFVREGWVRQKAAAGKRGQTRQMYSLTPLGRHELIRRLGEFGDAEARSPEAFHLRVGLFDLLAPEVREQILKKRRAHLEKNDAHFADLETQVELGRYGGEVVRHLRERARAEIQWIGRLGRVAARSKGNSTQTGTA